MSPSGCRPRATRHEEEVELISAWIGRGRLEKALGIRADDGTDAAQCRRPTWQRNPIDAFIFDSLAGRD